MSKKKGIKTRKVIQVCCSIDSVGKYFIMAVCDDGSLWQLGGLYEGEPKWDPFVVPPILIQEGDKKDA